MTNWTVLAWMSSTIIKQLIWMIITASAFEKQPSAQLLLEEYMTQEWGLTCATTALHLRNAPDNV